MSMSDPVADMLARLRNATLARHDTVEIPFSTVKGEIAAALRQEGYIEGFKIVRNEPIDVIRVKLKYQGDLPAIRGVKRVSRPGLRVYSKASQLPKVLNGLGSAILSTNRGILTDAEAREANVGGEVLCHIW
ncbi:MAG: 30S ribosomal protein S8 [Nitrospinae bacterium]|nr:30S ribosomal protein S8 [Nitrospinota bacterium]